MTALWQGVPLLWLAFDGPTLLGVPVDSGVGTERVVAVSQATGKIRWATSLPKSMPFTLGLFPAGNTIVVEGGRDASSGPIRGFALSGYMGLNAASGKILWTQSVSGTHAAPTAAVSSGYLVTGTVPGQLFPDTFPGPVTGRVAATGKVAWTLPQPKGCGNLGLAGDGPLLALSYDCGRQVLVERLDPATGKALWTWRSPVATAKGGASTNLTVTTVSSGGGLVLLSGGVLGTGAAQLFAAALPHPRTWPPLLASPLSGEMALALTAAGRPAWTETGGQQEVFEPTGDALCEEELNGFECRTGATGAPSVPAQIAYPGGIGTGYGGDDYAATADGLIAAISPVTGAGAGKAVELRVTDAGTGKIVATARIGISPLAQPGSDITVAAVAANPLTPTSALVLVRRVDVKGDPLLALSVSLPKGA